ncbi:uncharacterized protein LOC143648382 isoform X3 [Tamandua tetradactyla]|uniref:uncharacterized protein LOC143648382 isoform X3 n=1 Tax=Tamandua tetradactyla TaxID=48850 RepID=UPI00405487C6
MMLLLKSSSKKYKYRNLGLLLLSSIKLVKLSKVPGCPARKEFKSTAQIEQGGRKFIDYTWREGVLVHTRHTDGKQDRKIILSNSSVSLRWGETENFPNVTVMAHLYREVQSSEFKTA